MYTFNFAAFAQTSIRWLINKKAKKNISMPWSFYLKLYFILIPLQLLAMFSGYMYYIDMNPLIFYVSSFITHSDINVMIM